jgi:hypothetical protein
MKLRYLSSVWSDESVRNSVMLQRPVATLPRSDVSTRSFFRVAENVSRVFDECQPAGFPFYQYWQRIISRAQANNGATSVQKGDPLAGKSTASPSSKDTLISHSSGSANAEHFASWQALREQMSQFAVHPKTTPEHIISLITSCIEQYQPGLGIAAVDLMHHLLQKTGTTPLATEHLELLLIDINQLLLRSSSEVATSVAEPSEAAHSTKSDLHARVAPDLLAESMHPAMAAGMRTHGRGNRPSLSVSRDQISGLLESIKYASLVGPSEGER